MIRDDWPRQYAAEAIELWLSNGRAAAIDHIRDNCPDEWRKLAWCHVVIGMEKNGKKQVTKKER